MPTAKILGVAGQTPCRRLRNLSLSVIRSVEAEQEATQLSPASRLTLLVPSWHVRSRIAPRRRVVAPSIPHPFVQTKVSRVKTRPISLVRSGADFVVVILRTSR